ncbi:MAG: Nramp family divalent metal transporter [Planctomycetes bacterium]|nr:Nramp family divalent metal transporter [Planctomycetota bacterium]
MSEVNGPTPEQTSVIEPKKSSKGWWASLLLFLAFIGPGLITGIFGNDAGGITTYSVIGAKYGLSIIWMIIPVTLMLVIFQEMSGRMGAITGKGLSDLIRENFGIRIAFYLILAKLLAGMANALANFAGMAAALELFGVSKFITVPAMAVFIWLLAIKANYRRIEKIFLIGILFYAAYIVAGFLAPIDWSEVGRQVIRPSIDLSPGYFFLLVALIGTTVAPWMPFYQQSAVVEKELKISDYKYARWETPAAGLSVGVIIFFIILTCSTLGGDGIETAADAARALAYIPGVGQHATILFGGGLLVASIGAALIIPLSTSFSVCEIFGWESGVNKSFSDAPQFYGLFTLQIFVGAAIILIPDISLIGVMLISQMINGLLLPFVLIAMLFLVNDKKIMGQYTNRPLFNLAAIICTVLVSAAAIILVAMAIFNFN